MKSDQSRYGTAAVLIHWASAVLVLLLLVTGFYAASATEDSSKIAALRIHVPVAILVLVLTTFRIVWWWKFDSKPRALAGTPNWQDVSARWTHRFLYVFILLLLGSGVAISVMSGLPAAAFGSAEFPQLADLPPRIVHGIGARILVALVLIHASAALFHHYYLRDDTLRRMWFRLTS